jgi:hypothetical protein
VLAIKKPPLGSVSGLSRDHGIEAGQQFRSRYERQNRERRTINLMPLDEANEVFKRTPSEFPFDDELAPHLDAGFASCFQSSLYMHLLQSLRVKLYTSSSARHTEDTST